MTLRGTIITILGKVGHKGVIEEAQQRFGKFNQDSKYFLHPDLRQPVFDIVVAHGDIQEYESIMQLFKKSDFIEQKRCMIAFGRSKDITLLQRTLEFALSPEVRNQDLIWPLSSVAANRPHGTELAWEFVKKNFNLLVSKLSASLQGSVVEIATSYFCSEEKATEIENFFRENVCKPAERTILQNLESIHDNAVWLKKDRKEILAFFST